MYVLSVCTLSAGVHRGQRCLIHLELELRAVVRHLVWVLRLELVSSGRRVCALTLRAISYFYTITTKPQGYIQ